MISMLFDMTTLTTFKTILLFKGRKCWLNNVSEQPDALS